MISSELEQRILELLNQQENPSRIALSKKFPFFKNPIIFFRRFLRKVRNFFDWRLKLDYSSNYLDCVLARHQSVLRRKLGDSDPQLQERKVINLQRAIRDLDGLIIKPGRVFSFWKVLGRPSERRGYVKGMILANGQVEEGLGGGLCQLSNFLHWIFLHLPLKTIERHHHSLDVFPDSGRILPFGGGATVLYNFIDLKVKNVSDSPWQLKIWLKDNHLRGQVLSDNHIQEKFHIVEKNHYIVKRNNKYFRYNEIYRETKLHGRVVMTERVAINFAPIIYKINDEYIRSNGFRILDFSGK